MFQGRDVFPYLSPELQLIREGNTLYVIPRHDIEARVICLPMNPQLRQFRSFQQAGMYPDGNKQLQYEGELRITVIP